MDYIYFTILRDTLFPYLYAARRTREKRPVF